MNVKVTTNNKDVIISVVFRQKFICKTFFLVTGVSTKSSSVRTTE